MSVEGAAGDLSRSDQGEFGGFLSQSLGYPDDLRIDRGKLTDDAIDGGKAPGLRHGFGLGSRRGR
jgi:hypothetical protein